MEKLTHTSDPGQYDNHFLKVEFSGQTFESRVNIELDKEGIHFQFEGNEETQLSLNFKHVHLIASSKDPQLCQQPCILVKFSMNEELRKELGFLSLINDKVEEEATLILSIDLTEPGSQQKSLSPLFKELSTLFNRHQDEEEERNLKLRKLQNSNTNDDQEEMMIDEEALLYLESQIEFIDNSALYSHQDYILYLQNKAFKMEDDGVINIGQDEEEIYENTYSYYQEQLQDKYEKEGRFQDIEEDP